MQPHPSTELDQGSPRHRSRITARTHRRTEPESPRERSRPVSPRLDLPGRAQASREARLEAARGLGRCLHGRGGDRQVNKALHTIIVGRVKSDPETLAYVHRRIDEGLFKSDIKRLLKRFLARQGLKTDLSQN